MGERNNVFRTAIGDLYLIGKFFRHGLQTGAQDNTGNRIVPADPESKDCLESQATHHQGINIADKSLPPEILIIRIRHAVQPFQRTVRG